MRGANGWLSYNEPSGEEAQKCLLGSRVARWSPLRFSLQVDQALSQDRQRGTNYTAHSSQKKYSPLSSLRRSAHLQLRVSDVVDAARSEVLGPLKPFWYKPVEDLGGQIIQAGYDRSASRSELKVIQELC